MGGRKRESRTTYCYVFRAFGFRSTVADPLSAAGNHRLTFAYIERPAAGFDPEQTAKDDGVFVEVRRLTRLDPAAGAAHVGDADVIARGVHVAYIFVDQLGLGSGSLDAGGLGNEFGHRVFEFGTKRL